MRTLYIDCRLGARADAIASALLDTCPDSDRVCAELNKIWPEQIRYSFLPASIGIRLLFHDSKEELGKEESPILSEQDIWNMVENAVVSDRVRHDVRGIARILSKLPLKEYDLAMLMAIAIIIEFIDPDQILASTVEVGKGYMTDEAGRWLIPTSSVLSICKDMPIQGRMTEGEACDPAGAAALRYYADRYSDDLPKICMDQSGHGWSQSFYEKGQLYVKTILGRSDHPRSAGDRVVLIHANLDDMTGEAIGYAQEMLWAAGAVDVYTTAIMMKKNRPATMLSCICSPKKKDACVEAYMRYTTTLGVRIESMDREILERSFETRKTRAGEIRIKTAHYKNIKKWKAEYDDLRRIAQREGISLREAENYLKDDR